MNRQVLDWSMHIHRRHDLKLRSSSSMCDTLRVRTGFGASSGSLLTIFPIQMLNRVDYLVCRELWIKKCKLVCIYIYIISDTDTEQGPCKRMDWLRRH